MYGLISLDAAEAFAIAVPKSCGQLTFHHIEGSGVTNEQQFQNYQVYHFDNADKDRKVFRIDEIKCKPWNFERNVKLLTQLY